MVGLLSFFVLVSLGLALPAGADEVSTSWVSMGDVPPGANSWAEATAVDSMGNLYIGGYFTNVGCVAAYYVAKWNGSARSALRSLSDNGGRALAVSDHDLYAVGALRIAGGKISAYLARSYLDLSELSHVRSGSDLMVSWAASFGRFGLDQNPDVTNSNGWSIARFPFTTNGAIKSATTPLSPTNRFFRLIEN